MISQILCTTLLMMVASCSSASQPYNPLILTDTRSINSEASTYNFNYETEDGISHTSQSNNKKQVTGKVAYTDPTGLKVEISYAAGPLRSKPFPTDVIPDDGSYDPRKYRNSAQSTNYNTGYNADYNTGYNTNTGFDYDGYYYPSNSQTQQGSYYYPDDSYYTDDSYYYPEDR